MQALPRCRFYLSGSLKDTPPAYPVWSVRLFFIGDRAIAQEREARINGEITAKEVRLISPAGEQLGIVSIREAMTMAEEQDVDLVEISPTAKPPVCKLMDYGKFKYEQSKKRDEAKKKQKQVQIKEIKFRPGTDDGDYNIKMRNIRRFLADGDKVKVTLRFRGREMAHQELGAQLLKRVEADLTEEGTVEQFPKMEGRQMVMMVAPKKK
ncbi:translation initiation factor IF-3 [Neisseria sp. HSC-16F19]|nr:translation initiation factor IF-3 [Neisseria sp. HSC-16F19]MCP2039459.1 translation initiation factor IF-3 [Neisseria sp. HSC-16F19]